MRRISNCLFCVFFLFFCITGNAQTFKNEVMAGPVMKTGFYAVPVTPELSGYLKPDFRDLRILDDQGNPVPYIIKTGFPIIKSAEFQPLNILSNQLDDSGKSVIVIENVQGKKIADFFLKIKNTSVGRSIDLSGSDDRNHWFSISENIGLQKRFITGDDSYLEDIEFPLSSYHYFRLTIYNGKNDPLNVIAVGRYSGEEIKSYAPLIENPLCSISQKDSSNHISYIRVYNPQLFHVAHISLFIKGPKFFKRSMNIFADGQMSSDLTISSDSVFQFDLPVFKDSVWEIMIYNGDNPPLLVRSVSTAQELKKIIAYLETGKEYKIELNSDNAPLPHYELADFKDSISSSAPELKIPKIGPLANRSIADSNIFKQWWIWPAIAFVLAVLLLFTFRLSKEVAKKSD